MKPATLLAIPELSKSHASLSHPSGAQEADLDRNRIAERRPRRKARSHRGRGLYWGRDFRKRSAVVQRHAEGRRPHGGVAWAENRHLPAVPRFRGHARAAAQPYV